MKTAICAIIKNETIYLKEWVEWHLQHGFDAVHCYEDEGSDSHTGLVSDKRFFLEKFESTGISRLRYPQHHLFNFFAEKYKDKYDWVAFIDVDEFLHCNDLKKRLAEFSKYAVVETNTLSVGASGQLVADTATPVQERFSSVIESYDKRSQKLICNLKKEFVVLNVHVAAPLMGSGDILHSRNSPMVLRHYVTKSLEEFQAKLERGNFTANLRKLDDFYKYNPDIPRVSAGGGEN